MRSSEGLYFVRIDHLRALAAFLVFNWHFLHGPMGVDSATVPSVWLLSLLDEGHTGVALFMTLSGYIFARIVGERRIRYLPFLFNRLVRLMPLLALVLTCWVLLVYVKDRRLILDDVLKGFILPTWPGGGWSIAVELHFYAVFPLLLWLRSRIGDAIFIVMLVAMLMLRAALWRQMGEVQYLAYWTLIGRLDQFLCGIALYALSRRPWFAGVARWGAPIVFLLFTLFWHWFDAAGGVHHLGGYPSPSPVWIVLPTLEGLGSAALIAWYERAELPLPAWLESLLAKIGEASYSLYLWHFFFIILLEAALERLGLASVALFPALLASLVCFLVVAAGAHLSYRLIERPFLRFRVRYLDVAPAVDAAVATLPGEVATNRQPA